MEKHIIWQKIKQRDFQLPHQTELFTLLDEHLDQIVFVKDHIGVRDFLFLAEKKTEKTYTNTLFLALDVPVKKTNSLEENEELFKAAYENDPDTILEAVKQFLNESSRPLCIGIGFTESVTSEMDELVIALAFREGRISSILEGIRKIRRFPVWYAEEAKMPEELHFVSVEEEIEYIQHKVEDRIVALMTQIDEILEKDHPTAEDQRLFSQLSFEYNELTQAMNR